MPQRLREELRREAQGIAHELAIWSGEERRRDMMEKTKKIRFFEVQKAGRRLKRAGKEEKNEMMRKNVGGDGREEEEGIVDLDTATLDVAYTKYFPLEGDYVSLWPRKALTPEKSGMRNEIRARIRDALGGEDALEAIRNELTIYVEAIDVPLENAVGGKTGEDEDDDGGFFGV
jgi:hypothetical protein